METATSELQVAAREQDVAKKREETERLKQTIAATRSVGEEGRADAMSCDVF